MMIRIGFHFPGAFQLRKKICEKKAVASPSHPSHFPLAALRPRGLPSVMEPRIGRQISGGNVRVSKEDSVLRAVIRDDPQFLMHLVDVLDLPVSDAAWQEATRRGNPEIIEILSGLLPSQIQPRQQAEPLASLATMSAPGAPGVDLAPADRQVSMPRSASGSNPARVATEDPILRAIKRDDAQFLQHLLDIMDLEVSDAACAEAVRRGNPDILGILRDNLPAAPAPTPAAPAAAQPPLPRVSRQLTAETDRPAFLQQQEAAAAAAAASGAGVARDTSRQSSGGASHISDSSGVAAIGRFLFDAVVSAPESPRGWGGAAGSTGSSRLDLSALPPLPPSRGNSAASATSATSAGSTSTFNVRSASSTSSSRPKVPPGFEAKPEPAAEPEPTQQTADTDYYPEYDDYFDEEEDDYDDYDAYGEAYEGTMYRGAGAGAGGGGSVRKKGVGGGVYTSKHVRAMAANAERRVQQGGHPVAAAAAAGDQAGTGKRSKKSKGKAGGGGKRRGGKKK